MDVLAQIVSWINAGTNALGSLLLAPIGALPGWLSSTLVSAIAGILLLVVFKYTSDQRAIKRARDGINAHLLALKLFKDSVSVALAAQEHILLGAFRLMLLALVPMAVMALPVALLMGQIGLWYQYRPLHVGEEALVSVKLNRDITPASPEAIIHSAIWAVTSPRHTVADSSLALAVAGSTIGASSPTVRLMPTDALETTLGPVRAIGPRSIHWNVRARENGYHRLVFEVDGQVIDKELAIGDGIMRVSAQRPHWLSWEALEHPGEQPFGPNSPVRSIEIEYPERDSWTSGTDYWVFYFFGVSMLAGLCFSRALKVNI